MKNLLIGAITLIFLAGGAMLILTGAQDSEAPGDPQEAAATAAAQAADDSEFIEKPMHTTRIDSIITTDSLVTFNVKVQTPNPCWKFARYEIEKKNDEVFVTVIARKKKDEICIQMIGSFETKVPVEVSGSGEYTYRFWCQNSTTLDTVITVQ